MAVQARDLTTPIDSAGWSEGSVWVIHYVRTKPGRFVDYVKEFRDTTVRYLNVLKADGRVLSHKLLRNDFPRQAEWDVIHLVEYKDKAALDQSVKYQESVVKRVWGTIRDASTSEVSREELREECGSILLTELLVEP